MKKIYFIIIVGLLSSCSVTKKNEYLFPANSSINMKYTPRPYLIDTVKSKTYLQANYQSFTGNNNDDFNQTNALELSISRGHQLKVIQFCYGASITTGTSSYSVFNADASKSNRVKDGFGSVLLHGGINGVTKFKEGEFRYLSLDFGFSKEFGDYPTNRKKFEGKEFYTTVSNTSISTLGLGTEICFTNGKVKFAAKLGVAKNLGSFKYTNQSGTYNESNSFPYIALHASYKNFTITSEGSDNIARLGLGFSF
jgi:hypothetical protein